MIMLKKSAMMLCLCIATLTIYAQPTAPESNFIKIDQFGYLPDVSKVAVISDPQIGYNASDAFTPGGTYQLREWTSGNVVFTASPQAWNGGTTHTQSGDRGWWFDFSSVTDAGTYYVYDVGNGVRSYQFDIDENVYNEVLKTAGRMFYYNRCNTEKVPPYAEGGWTDGTSFLNNLQDANCRYIFDQDNPATEKDLSGGWYDAGDFNKYVTFADRVMHDLLWAYQENPEAFGDNWDIPESSNGIPDIIDEIKWELEWLLKMNNSDGSTHLKMGSKNYSENTQTPPSLNTDPRYYGPTCTSASISVAGVFAHAAKVFSDFSSMNTFTQELQTSAENTWDYVLPLINTNQFDTSCDNGEITSGDADWDVATQRDKALKAAVHLFDLTGENAYSQYVMNNIAATEQIANAYWAPYKMPLNDALLLYTTIAGADAATVTTITNSIANDVSGNNSNFYGFDNSDLYRGAVPDWMYHWGSNLPKASTGVMNRWLVKYDINSANNADYDMKADEMVHYFHGTNPLGITYLTNMYNYGAENCANEMYHQWFADGSVWDNALTSTYGPAPGYITGGANKDFSVGSISPPANQPPQKSYLDFNDGFPESSWEISEPAIYYQAAYLRLLANVAGVVGTFSEDCPPVIDLGTALLSTGTNHAQNEVISSGTVPAGTDVSLKAGDCVRLNSGFSSAANADLELIIEDCEASASDCELITNGTFNTDINPWVYWNCTPASVAGVANLTNITSGADPWDAGFTQAGFSLAQGRIYTVSFNARSDANRTIVVKVGQAVAPFNAFAFETINLTTSMQTHTFTFTMTDPSYNNSSLEFYLGLSPSSVYLDDASLVEFDCTGCIPAGVACDDSDPNTINDVQDGSCMCSGTPIQNSCQLLQNPTFDTNIANWNNWNCTPTAVSGIANLTGIIPGVDPWDAGFNQGNISIVQGATYTVSFLASADSNRTVVVKVGQAVAPFAAYAFETVNLTTSMQTHTVTFTMNDPTDNNVNLDFLIGGDAANVYLDYVSLIEDTCTP